MSTKAMIDEIYVRYGDDIVKTVEKEGNLKAAFDYGITVKDVKKICRMFGGAKNEVGDIPREVLDEWRREFELCKSVKSIGDSWGCSPQVVRDALENDGVDTHGNLGNSGNDMDRAKKLALKGMSFGEIVDKTGITEAGIWLAVNMEGDCVRN